MTKILVFSGLFFVASSLSAIPANVAAGKGKINAGKVGEYQSCAAGAQQEYQKNCLGKESAANNPKCEAHAKTISNCACKHLDEGCEAPKAKAKVKAERKKMHKKEMKMKKEVKELNKVVNE